MSKDAQTITNLQTALRDFKKQRSNCYGIVLHFSKLERIYKESSYRRSAAAALQPLIRTYNAKTFLLEDGDMFILVGPANLDVIDKSIGHVRECFEGSLLIAGIIPQAGVNDDLTSWYPLEAAFEAFDTYVRSRKAGSAITEPQSSEPAVSQSPSEAAATPAPAPTPAKPRKDLKLVAFPSDEPEDTFAGPARSMDLDMFKSFVMNIMSADLVELMQRESVMALVPGVPPAPVITHRYVPFSTVMHRSFGNESIIVDPWFEGYINDLLADRLISALQGLPTEKSIASSLRVTSRIVMSPTFDRFCRQLGDTPRKRIILEFSVFDAMSDTAQYIDASAKVRDQGFRVQMADMDTRAFMWLQAKSLEVSFVKLSATHAAYETWLAPTKPPATDLRQALTAFGPERVILADCVRTSYVEAAQKLGFYLFMGPALDEMTNKG